MTIDERLCVTVQAISPVREVGISHVGWAVFVIEPDRQQAIVLSAEREREESGVRRQREREQRERERIRSVAILAQVGDTTLWLEFPLTFLPLKVCVC